MSAETTRRGDEPKRLIDVSALEVADRALMTREQARVVIDKVRKASKADEVVVTLGSRHTTNIRFAANQLSTSGGVCFGGSSMSRPTSSAAAAFAGSSASAAAASRIAIARSPSWASPA